MTDENLRRNAKLVEGVTVTPVSLEDIPSDDGSDVKMDIIQIPNGDLGFWIHGQNSLIFYVRINCYSGGGPYGLIHNDFVELIRNFDKANGQIPPGFPPLVIDSYDYIPSYAGVRIQEGEATDAFRIRAQGIESMDDFPDEDSVRKKFMDIEVLKDGDVKVNFTKISPTAGQLQVPILFKSAQNGGKFPLIAETFTRAAVRLEAASKNK